MTDLYRGPHGWVTHEAIATADTGWHRYAIADLHRVHIVRSRSGTPPGPQVLTTSTLLVALVTIPVVRWPAVLLTAVLVVATLAGAVARRRRNRVHWELSALHRGVQVRLFASTDQREFDQVCRAVQRALEHGERR